MSERSEEGRYAEQSEFSLTREAIAADLTIASVETESYNFEPRVRH